MTKDEELQAQYLKIAQTQKALDLLESIDKKLSKISRPLS